MLRRKMKNKVVFALAMIFSLAIASVYGQNYSESETVTPGAKVEKVTHLRFFYHDILSDEYPTPVLISHTNITDTASFLNLFAMDDSIIIGPEPIGAIIGDVDQGVALLSSRDPPMFNAVLHADWAFTTGVFNGSSFSFSTRYPSAEYFRGRETVRELATVDGIDALRMVKGFALVRASSVNAKIGDAVLEFIVTLHHY